MDNYICVGKIINTFGIKGELKINCDFEYKDKIFNKDFPIYIGEFKNKEIVNSHRIHKNYDLVNFIGYSNINEVLKYKNEKIYIKREDLDLSENDYLLNDLIGLNVYDNDKLIGVILDYEQSVNYILLKIKGEKNFYIPLIDKYIKEVNIKDKQIITNNGSELIL